MKKLFFSIFLCFQTKSITLIHYLWHRSKRIIITQVFFITGTTSNSFCDKGKSTVGSTICCSSLVCRVDKFWTLWVTLLLQVFTDNRISFLALRARQYN